MALRLRNHRRLLGVAVVLLVVVAVLGLWAGSVFAASPTATAYSSTGVVAMNGTGTVVGGEESSQLRIKLASSGGTRWLLEMTLNPLNAQRNSSGLVVYTLGGSFTLGTTDHPLATGAASGTMDQNGKGDIKLTQSGGSAALDVPFTVQGSAGGITAQVSGTWPALPVVQPTTTSTATAAPVNHFWWYLSRDAGLLAYLLLFVSIAFGLILRTNQASTARRRVYLELHQFLAVLGLGFMALHILALLGDTYIGYTPAQLFVPSNLPYRPLATAIGIFGMYAFVLVMLVFALRRWLGRKLWRVVHGAAILMFVLVLLHSITAGTDTAVPWVRWMYALTAAATVFLAINHYFRKKPVSQAVKATVRPARAQRPGSR